MTQQPDLTIEILRSIQGTLSDLKNDMRRIDTRLAAIEQHMSGFHITLGLTHEQYADLKTRIERIEQRLELSD